MNIFNKKLEKEKKKTYVAENPDWMTIGFWILIVSFILFFIARYFVDKIYSFSFLLLFPAIIGVLFIFFYIPFRSLTFFLTTAILYLYLRNVPRNQPMETVIILEKNDYWRPSFWITPNYDTNLLLIIKYLNIIKSSFAIYENIDIETFDSIMANETIKIVYVIGHGRRHGYCLDNKTSVDYCRYKDNNKYNKEFLYQLHCNHGNGTSLVEYVVTKEHQKECLPEYGYMSNTTINQMFIDKIILYKNYVGIKAKIKDLWYNMLTLIIPTIVLFGWMYLGFLFIKYFVIS